MMKQRLLTRMACSGLLLCALSVNALAQTPVTTTGGLASILAPHPITAAGQSATQLPDGSWLLLGGQNSASAASSDATLVDAKTGKASSLTIRLNQARTGHNATLLPDGSVLVLGGQDAKGQIVTTAEQFDPVNAIFTSLGNLGLIARSGQTVTVLDDGKLLIAGGTDAHGQALVDVELFNPVTRLAESFNVKLDMARVNHVAALLPNANVLLWGGIGNVQQVLNNGSLYDFVNQRFTSMNAATASSLAQSLTHTSPPGIQSSQPIADAQAVPINQPLIIRFTKRMSVATLNTLNVTLVGPQGPVSIKPVPVEYGLLLFITPQQELLPATHYTLFMDGATDIAGQPLPFTAIGFTTGSLPGQNTSSNTTDAFAATGAPSGTNAANANTNPSGAQAVVEEETWIPQARNYHGEWTSGHAGLARLSPPRRIELKRAYLFTALQRDGRIKREQRESHLPPVLQSSAAPGVTALVGQTLKLNGQPLVGVTVSIGNQKTITDDNGEFLLTNIPDGSPALQIDGSSASTAQRRYGRYFYQIHIKSGKVNAMPQPVWMVKLDTQHAIHIASPTTKDTVISNPLLPGLEVHLPAGTVIRNADGKVVTEVTLTPVPADQLPFPMPYGEVPVYYTLQPGGAVIQSVSGKPQGATVIYPNYSTQQPGAKFELFDYDPYGRGWYVYSNATVSPDGKRIVSDKGFLLYQFSASSAASSGGPAANGPGGCNDESCKCPQGGIVGDPVTCHEGMFLENNTDLELADKMPISLTRSYHNEDPNQHSFGIGASHSYDLYLYFVNQYINQNNNYAVNEIDLVLGNGGRIPFNVVGSNNIYTNGAVYQSLTPGRFYQAQLSTAGDMFNFRLTLKDGTVYTFSYYSSKLVSVQDRWGNNIGITRDGTGRIQQITAANGRRMEFQYNAANCTSCITAAIDNMARQVSYQYDTAGRLSQVIDAVGGVTTYSYDPATNRMLTVNDPRNNTGEITQPKVTNVYYTSADSAYLNGRVKQQTFADGATNLYAYSFDSNGNVIQTNVTDERGYVRRIDYTSIGQIAKETLALGAPEQQITTNVWDPATQLLTSTTDPLGRQTAYTYDTVGNVKTVTQLAGTANAVTTSYTYTSTYNQIASITDPLLNTINFTYDPQGNLIQIKDANGNSINNGYNNAGQLISMTNALGKVTSLNYDNSDLVQVIDALNRHINISTDAVGRTIGITDPLGNRTSFNYDNLRPIQTMDALNQSTGYSHDANGNLTKVTDAKSNLHQYTFDSRNAVSSNIDPLNKSEYFLYDANHNVSQKTDRKGQVTKYTYDTLNRLTTITYADNSLVTFTYDVGNRVTQITDSTNGTISNSYDDLNRLTLQTTPQGSVSYTYYANGLRKTMTVSGQPTLTYTYDAGNRLMRIDQAAGVANNNIAQSIAFSYDNANRRTQTQLANGQTINYSYDDANQLTGILYKNASGGTVGDLGYAYDTAGRRIQSSGSFARTTLSSAASNSGIDVANRLTIRNGQSLTYDLNGNLISDGVNTYTWNARNQLTQISGGITSSFSYDGLGRRQSKTVNGIGTSYVYDGVNPVQELNGIGIDNSSPANIRASYLTGLGVDEVYAQQIGMGSTAQTNSYLRDALGSIIRLVNSSGDKLVDYTYDPYGNTTADAAINNPFQYAGRENDGNGLYYYRARYYSPTLQRFISQDPIGLGGGINEYSYVEGDPVSSIDPLGLQSIPGGGTVSDATALGNYAFGTQGDGLAPSGAGLVNDIGAQHGTDYINAIATLPGVSALVGVEAGVSALLNMSELRLAAAAAALMQALANEEGLMGVKLPQGLSGSAPTSQGAHAAAANAAARAAAQAAKNSLPRVIRPTIPLPGGVGGKSQSGCP